MTHVPGSYLRTAVLLATALAVRLPTAAGHGYLTEPPARNAQAGPRNDYCPHCGNGAGICGDGGQWPSTSNYLEDSAGPVRTYRAGEVAEFKVKITAHHLGYFELAVCDQHIGPSTSDPQGCLNKFRMQRVRPEDVYSDCKINDPRGTCHPRDEQHPERWYLTPGTGDKTMHFRIPADLQCASCTLQWRWWSANSCTPQGYNEHLAQARSLGWSVLQTSERRSSQQLSGLAGCGGEEFRNCADIAVVGSGGPLPTPAPSPAPQPAPGPAPTGAPAPAPTPPTTASRCVPLGDCGAQGWCDQQAYGDWCGARLDSGSCPQLWCRLQAQPSPMPAPAGGKCGTCSGCLFASNGGCYTDVGEAYCATWADNTWCGASMLELKAPRAAQSRRMERAAGSRGFLGAVLLQEGAALARAGPASDGRAEEL